MNFQLFVVVLLSLYKINVLGEKTDENSQKRWKNKCNKGRSCPKEAQSLFITCGEKDSLYMGNLEDDFMRHKNLTDPTRCFNDKWNNIEEVDFIVVGAGLGGSVVAGRLSEEPKWSVAVLEAGDAAPAATAVPAFYFNYHQDPSIDWNYQLVRQDNACLRTEGVCSYPRGKVVGGTANLHGMMYMRGSPIDYDNLEHLGINNWTWNDVFPYFLKSEDNLNIGQYPIEANYHSSKGPLAVSHFNSYPKFAETLLQAYKEMGKKINVDLNGKSQDGFALAQATTKDGIRVTTARAYLYNNLHRDNLIILPNTRVTKVIIDPKRKTATGVEYIRNGEWRVLKARKEVILSAGAIESPHVLLTSGIGPKEQLENIGVNVTVDRKGVGKNLHNHLSTELFFHIPDESNTAVLDQIVVNQYFQQGTGPLSSTGLSQLTGFVWTNISEPRPDLQIFHAGFTANCSGSGLKGERSGPGSRVFSISPTVLNVKSKGEIQLRNIFPTSYPLVYGGIMDDPQDIQILLKGIRYIQNITTTPTMKNLNVTMDKTVTKGCENMTYDSDEYWICHIQHNTNPENHQVGTCKMGPANDDLAVTNNRLQVIGVNRLRVADASILPYTPRGNVQAPIIMVAERAASFIKDDWGKKV